MNPIEGLLFASVEQHALPVLSDGFFREYRKTWMDSFKKHLVRYDPHKLESVLQTIMKKLASTLSWQRGIQYIEYLAQKAAGILKQTHLKPLSQIFTPEQLSEIPIDNKVGENYFRWMTAQLRKKGRAAFNVIGERLVLSSNADWAFTNGAEKMLKRQKK